VPEGDAAETYEVRNGTFTYKSAVDHGSGRKASQLEYSALGGTFDSIAYLLDELMMSSDHSLNLIPSGHAMLLPLTTLEVSNGHQKKTLQAYAITGIALSPVVVWTERGRFFGLAGVMNFLPQGWEAAASEMNKTQDAALSKLVTAVSTSLAKVPAVPVAFKNVKLYDADARRFRSGVTVVVNEGRIADVGSVEETKVPTGAQVIDGTGKALIPGLWDSHQHYFDDYAGLLLLASGITSVRDPGNKIEALLARRERIKSGELLGTRIVPSMMIDGPGEYAAQVAVVVHNVSEAVAAVQSAKAKGYFGIKLYGSLDPTFIKPMADEAHKLGLRVHGHIPHGMRPLDAVKAGYDEITHINFVIMQAMPDDVVNTSNTLNRFVGVARLAKDVDLNSPMMSSYLDQLAARHIAIDPTLVTFEDGYVPERGTYPPSDAPYAGTMPAQVARAFLSSSLPPTPELSRKTMLASFAKLEALVQELNRRNIPILAGTDNNGFELIRELELYVEAGLTPEDALATATIIPAKAFGLNEQTGSIVKGKLAELALIDGDPEKQIGDLRQVELVMRDGKLMEAQELRKAIGISGAPSKMTTNQ
jgi:imidazolonepropionase-like amidohydrolase